jgi:hypothetical protein
MNTEYIYRFLANRQPLSEDTAVSLKELTEKFPWFGGGHVLHALYSKQIAAPDTDRHLAKAQLYFNNPLWFKWELLEKKEDAFPDPQTEQTQNKSPTDLSPLAFEPLHTIDYFASQGIRLKQEQLGSDKFSQQVKTFTQWLQSMKKIYHTESGSGGKTEDKNITQMADASNEQKDILTETMAEVLIQQGKPLQAIQILEKLSLLHPEKSSYFTTRISTIKNRN